LDIQDIDDLYEYISGLKYKPYFHDISKKYILDDVLEAIDTPKENPLNKWYNMVSDSDFFLHKIASLRNKQRVAFIKQKSINIHRYEEWDYHKRHVDNAAAKTVEALDDIGWGKFLGFHLSLTKWWKPWDGWELVFYLPNGEEIIYPPEYNTLWIYSASELTHEVKSITKWSKLTRFTLLNMYYGKIN